MLAIKSPATSVSHLASLQTSHADLSKTKDITNCLFFMLLCVLHLFKLASYDQ